MRAIQQFLEGMVAALSRFAAAVESTTARLFAALLQFVEDVADWLLRVAKAIADYLRRFFTALVKVVFALGKLSLFYVPSVVCVLWSISFSGGAVAILVAIGWALFVTGIGLAYWKKVKEA